MGFGWYMWVSFGFDVWGLLLFYVHDVRVYGSIIPQTYWEQFRIGTPVNDVDILHGLS
jgi:hypothetical protein